MKSKVVPNKFVLPFWNLQKIMIFLRNVKLNFDVSLKFTWYGHEYECVSDENGINLKLQAKKFYTCIPVHTYWNVYNLFLTNSSFKHPSRHITT